ESRQRDVLRYRVQPEHVTLELDRLAIALQTVKTELGELADGLPDAAPAEARALLDVHEMILDDPALAEAARESIREHLWNAEWALSAQAGHLAAQFAGLDDEYLRERGRDVEQVADRVLRALSGTRTAGMQASEPAIFVAADIAPADML